LCCGQDLQVFPGQVSFFQHLEYGERQTDLMLARGPFGDHAAVRGVHRLAIHYFGYDLLPIK